MDLYIGHYQETSWEHLYSTRVYKKLTPNRCVLVDDMVPQAWLFPRGSARPCHDMYKNKLERIWPQGLLTCLTPFCSIMLTSRIEHEMEPAGESMKLYPSFSALHCFDMRNSITYTILHLFKIQPLFFLEFLSLDSLMLTKHCSGYLVSRHFTNDLQMRHIIEPSEANIFCERCAQSRLSLLPCCNHFSVRTFWERLAVSHALIIVWNIWKYSSELWKGA